MVTTRSWEAATFIEIKDFKDNEIKPMYEIRNSCRQRTRRVRIWQPEPASPQGKKGEVVVEPGSCVAFCFDNPDASLMVEFGMCVYIYYT
jgi:hypothetical protein